MSSKSRLDNMSGPPWDPKQPFQGLPKLPPEAPLETYAVLKGCIRARAALAELKQASRLIPNPAILLASMPVLEAKASSEIENIVTTADELFRHLEDDGGADPATKEALRYREALLEGFRALDTRPLSFGIAERVCTRIKAIEMGPRKISGTYIGNIKTGEVLYTPPSGEALLRELLSNWEMFLHQEDDLDPLVRMAVAHYQFEAIHPFLDGNGRTGRVLNSLFLVESGLIETPIVYLSRYIIQNKAGYYSLLNGVTRSGAWEPWILYMLDAVAETSIWTIAKIEAIAALHAATRDHLRQVKAKIYSAEFVELLFLRPYCRIQHLVDAGIATRQTASRYLKSLVAAGILAERKQGKERLFAHVRLLELLTTEANTVAGFG